MNNQEAFDTMLNHLRQQGQRSLTAEGSCAYRGENGLMCAVGALIPDDEYKPYFDGENQAADQVRRQCPSLKGIDYDLLISAQISHDISTHDFDLEIEKEFQLIAKRFGLVYTPKESK